MENDTQTHLRAGWTKVRRRWPSHPKERLTTRPVDPLRQSSEPFFNFYKELRCSETPEYHVGKTSMNTQQTLKQNKGTRQIFFTTLEDTIHALDKT